MQVVESDSRCAQIVGLLVCQIDDNRSPQICCLSNSISLVCQDMVGADYGKLNSWACHGEAHCRPINDAETPCEEHRRV